MIPGVPKYLFTYVLASALDKAYESGLDPQELYGESLRIMRSISPLIEKIYRGRYPIALALNPHVLVYGDDDFRGDFQSRIGPEAIAAVKTDGLELVPLLYNYNSKYRRNYTIKNDNLIIKDGLSNPIFESMGFYDENGHLIIPLDRLTPEATLYGEGLCGCVSHIPAENIRILSAVDHLNMDVYKTAVLGETP